MSDENQFYILYNECVKSEKSTKQYGSWSEHNDITPRKIIYGAYNSAQEIHERFDNYETIPFLDEKEPDFDAGFYVIYGIYSAGDSFGRATGRVEWIGLTQDVTFLRFLLKKLRKADDYNINFTYNNKKYEIYVPWNGYFETLESIEYDVITLALTGQHNEKI